MRYLADSSTRRSGGLFNNVVGDVILHLPCCRPFHEFIHVEVEAHLPGLVTFCEQSADKAQSRFVVRANANDPFATADLGSYLLPNGCGSAAINSFVFKEPDLPALSAKALKWRR